MAWVKEPGAGRRTADAVAMVAPDSHRSTWSNPCRPAVTAGEGYIGTVGYMFADQTKAGIEGAERKFDRS